MVGGSSYRQRLPEGVEFHDVAANPPPLVFWMATAHVTADSMPTGTCSGVATQSEVIDAGSGGAASCARTTKEAPQRSMTATSTSTNKSVRIGRLSTARGSTRAASLMRASDT